MRGWKTAVFAATAMVSSAGALSAAPLLLTSVTGSLTFNGGSPNYFDPVNGKVPIGFLNTSGTTVTINEPAIEYGFDDSSNRDTANFTNSQLIITDQAESGAVSVSGGGSSTISSMSSTYTFTDAAFAGLTPNQVASSFTVPVTASIVGTTLTVSVPAFTVPTNYQQVIAYNFVAVPEPTTAAFGLGVAGLAMVRRRKR